MNSEIRRVTSASSNSSLKQSCSALTSVTSALEVINVMRSINPRFTYLLTNERTFCKSSMQWQKSWLRCSSLLIRWESILIIDLGFVCWVWQLVVLCVRLAEFSQVHGGTAAGRESRTEAYVRHHNSGPARHQQLAAVETSPVRRRVPSHHRTGQTQTAVEKNVNIKYFPSTRPTEWRWSFP